MTDIEIIDVEAFHREKKQNSGDVLKKKCRKLEADVKDLATKNNSFSHANDALRRRVFDKEQCSQRVARLLGFEDIESAEARISSEDPWIPGGQAALADALARNLQLEGELARSVTANKEAQLAIREAQDQLSDMEAEAARLREGRDFARQVAEQHAAEAYRWRTEVQTTLPEMQALIQELQMKNKVQSEPRSSAGKENISVGRGEASSSPLRNLINTTSPTVVDAVSPDVDKVSDSQHYKQQFELIQAQYNALLESKKRISVKYKEDLVHWKKFKEWMVKDGKGVGGRRLVRRRKKVQEIGQDPDVCDLGSSDPTAPAKLDGPMHDPDVTLLDQTNTMEAAGHGASGKYHHPPGSTACSPPLSPVKPLPIHGPDLPFLPESLTQQSSTPPASSSALRVAHASRVSSTTKNVPASQESLTQQSSPPPPSPQQKNIAALPSKAKVTTELPDRREIIGIDSSPDRLQTVKQEPLEERMVNNNHAGPSRPQVTNQRVKSLRSQLTPDHRTGISMTCSEFPPDRKRPHSSLPRSEPPPMNKNQARSSFSLDPKAGKGHAIRRTSTVLVKDTPPRASAGAVFRHHSSPPDSPHVSCEDPYSSPSAVRRGKRKAAEMHEEEDDQRESNSDPFLEGLSCTKATHGVPQTREEKSAHLKALSKKPHKEYMAEYMPFKGRGRYSNVTTAAEKTVNAEFEIDPAKNSGLSYQFDAVVRDKAERKKLEAGDCECCRDYYEAVGPLPPRLQPPLWRSPSSSQGQHRPCRKKNGESSRGVSSSPAQKKAIDAHKHEISRHRHNWAPTNTPPDYWRIGFPDTQEVEDINRRANDLHARKFQRVEKEANSKDGRYRRRA